MTITEALMRPGSGRVRLRDDAPLWVTDAIRSQLMGAGGHFVITPNRIDPVDGVTDAHLLQVALYTGRLIGSPSRTEFDLVGASTWLDSATEALVAFTAGTPTQWVDAVVLNGLTRGVVSGGANVTKSFPAYAQTYRAILDHVAQLGGWEYEVRPNFAINAGTSVFVTTPKVIVTRRSEGRDGVLTGLSGGLVDQAIDAQAQASKVVALGRGAGAGILVGSSVVTTPLRTKAGVSPTLVQVVNAPNANATEAAAIATSIGQTVTLPTVNVTADTAYQPAFVDAFTGQILAPAVTIGPDGSNGAQLIGTGAYDPASVAAIGDAARFAASVGRGTAPRRSIDGSELNGEQPSRLHLRAGDTVYLYDPESGLIDRTQQAFYRGETVFPMVKRVLEHTWKVRRGFGVVWRGNVATPATSNLTLIDLTPWVEWEEGGDELVIGDKSSTTFAAAGRSGLVTGAVNRQQPEIGARFADPEWTSYTPAPLFGGVNTNIADAAGEYLLDRDMVDVLVKFRTLGGVGAGNFSCTLPFPVHASWLLTGAASAHGAAIGQARLLDAGTNWRSATVYVDNGSASTARVDLAEGFGYNDPMRQLAPWTWALDDGVCLILRYRRA